MQINWLGLVSGSLEVIMIPIEVIKEKTLLGVVSVPHIRILKMRPILGKYLIKLKTFYFFVS